MDDDVLVDCIRTALMNQRLALGLSQEQLAVRMGTAQSHISALENSLTQPRLSTWFRWAEALECSLIVTLRTHTGTTSIESS